MRTLIATFVLLCSTTASGWAHDYYHDEYWCHDPCHAWCRPDVAPTKLDMAWNLYEKGRWQANHHSLDLATTTIKEAIELCPKIGRFHLTLGLVLRDQGKRDEAISEFRLGRQYGFGCVEEEAHWALKALGADTTATTEESPATPKTEAAPKGEEGGEIAPAPAVKKTEEEASGAASEKPGPTEASPATKKTDEDETSPVAPPEPPKISTPKISTPHPPAKAN